ncbi:piggyBac transposable element-derived protein 4-like [Lineus longissimus]|uniref:piggyBac transposable element-derived protein 4-like n=1 Tax=Lineus longissimus TaxID=88925 RepID=UPI00315DAF0C
MIRHIKDETNRYFHQWWRGKEAEAARTGADVPDKRTKAEWVDTTDAEIKAFIAVMIVIGNNKRPRFKYYWSLEWLIDMVGYGSTVMRRDRFMVILRFLHVADNTRAIPRGNPGHDRCFKIRPMLRILVPQWQAVFFIDKCTSIDEGMIGFKGRVYMRQYMPKKPTKWGLKAWILAGSKTGFVYKWQLYTGKEGDQVEVNLGQRVVLELSQILLRGHEVYCDKFFTCYELLETLQGRGIACCGTVRSNRVSNPQEQKDFTVKRQGKANLQRLSPIFKRCGDILAVSWYDKRPVTKLSRNHTSEMVTKRLRDREAEGGYRRIEKPQAVVQYN